MKSFSIFNTLTNNPEKPYEVMWENLISRFYADSEIRSWEEDMDFAIRNALMEIVLGYEHIALMDMETGEIVREIPTSEIFLGNFSPENTPESISQLNIWFSAFPV